MSEEALTKKALGYIVKHIKDYEKIGQEDYSHLIFDIVREGVAIVNAVISIFESANIDSIVFKKQPLKNGAASGHFSFNIASISSDLFKRIFGISIKYLL